MTGRKPQVEIRRWASRLCVLFLVSFVAACADDSESGTGASATGGPSVTAPVTPNPSGTPAGLNPAPPSMTSSPAIPEPAANPTSTQLGGPNVPMAPVASDPSGVGGNSPVPSEGTGSGGASGGMGGGDAAAGGAAAGAGGAAGTGAGGAQTDTDAGAPSGGSGGGAGGGSAEPTFQPCPAEGPCKIMPFGDSITEGCCDFNGGYRVELIRLAREAGQDITYVGSASNGPSMVDGMPFPQNHEGHGGYTIDDNPARNTNGISPFVATSVPAYMPDIITLMIGTNDINGNIDVQMAPARLGALLDSIFDEDPDVLVVLAQIVPTTNDGTNQAVQTYNAAIPDLVSERVEMGRHLILVDMYEAFTRDPNYKSSLMADGLHPNSAGYARMAETWYAAIAGYLR